jgi:hypothetical protein
VRGLDMTDLTALTCRSTSKWSDAARTFDSAGLVRALVAERRTETLNENGQGRPTPASNLRTRHVSRHLKPGCDARKAIHRAPCTQRRHFAHLWAFSGPPGSPVSTTWPDHKRSQAFGAEDQGVASRRNSPRIQSLRVRGLGRRLPSQCTATPARPRVVGIERLVCSLTACIAHRSDNKKAHLERWA